MKASGSKGCSRRNDLVVPVWRTCPGCQGNSGLASLGAGAVRAVTVDVKSGDVEASRGRGYGAL